MLDIIDRAQIFYVHTLGGGILEGECTEEAVAFIKELAQERYVYTAEVFMNHHWIFMWSPRTGNSVEGKWKATHKEAEKFAEQWQLDYPTRIVKRRVSPIEVSE